MVVVILLSTSTYLEAGNDVKDIFLILEFWYLRIKLQPLKENVYT